MGGITFISGIQVEWQECLTCGVMVVVPKILMDQHRKIGGHYHCCNGHSQGWDKSESEDEKIRRERDRLRQMVAQKNDEIQRQRDLRDHADRQAAAARGQITKLKKRASAGLCPCCNRHFTDLRRHMASKHKDDSNIIRLKTA